MDSKTYQKLLLAFVVIFYAWTLYGANDKFTWCLEIFPGVLFFIILALTYRKFPLSNLSYTLIALHMLIFAYGGQYTYAETPLGYWLSEIFGWTRNNYDKIGHFAQGFVPAIWGREIFIRLKVAKNTRWMNFLLVGTILGFSAFYELLEWWVSLASGTAGDSFLGTQGYIWDTQSDMLMCLIGSIVALLLLSKLHDRSMEKIQQ